LGELASLLVDTATEYEIYLTRTVGVWRAREHAEHPDELGESREIVAGKAEAGDFVPDEASQAHLGEVYRLWYELTGIYLFHARHRAIIAHLTTLKNRRQRRPVRPDQAAICETIADSAKRLTPLKIETIGNGGY